MMFYSYELAVEVEDNFRLITITSIGSMHCNTKHIVHYNIYKLLVVVAHLLIFLNIC